MNIVKYLQAQGLGSRKLCKSFIADGRVQINGTLVTDERITVVPNDVTSLRLDGDEICVIPLPYFYLKVHKPTDCETSHKPIHHISVFSLLPDNLRYADLQAVGRLDEDTTGVLIITNDGHFNHKLTSPKHHVPKVYHIGLKHPVTADFCAVLERGVLLKEENEVVCAQEAVLLDESHLVMTITSGKYHQVKRMIAAAGNRVVTLHRTQFGQLSLGDLPEGEWAWIQPEDVLS